jgi:hypothetical protein
MTTSGHIIILTGEGRVCVFELVCSVGLHFTGCHISTAFITAVSEPIFLSYISLKTVFNNNPQVYQLLSSTLFSSFYLLMMSIVICHAMSDCLACGVYPICLLKGL